MLSKKMTFSLMSLITLLAFAFAVPSAMAAAFEIKIAGPTTVNYSEDSSNPASQRYFGQPITVMLKVSSGQPIDDLTYALPVVDPDTDEITVAAFDEDGFVVPIAGQNVAVVDLPKLIAGCCLCDENTERASVVGYY